LGLTDISNISTLRVCVAKYISTVTHEQNPEAKNNRSHYASESHHCFIHIIHALALVCKLFNGTSAVIINQPCLVVLLLLGDYAHALSTMDWLLCCYHCSASRLMSYLLVFVKHYSIDKSILFKAGA
jgi:hypothetical protein